ncbi:cyclopropane-fatty-acyl-phospholipid synthase family protein [Candidatus Parcubacteria bacterium]|nr:cyclopropane-fatty-acyl-phospholipid synthase family protein [Candidatus Parcubacteria bacterium]
MLAKTIFEQGLAHIRVGAVTVDYWGTEVKTYGNDQPYFTLKIKQPAALKGMVKHLSLGFGEAYTNGQVEVEGPLDQVMRLAAENKLAMGGLWRQLTARPQPNSKQRQAGQIQQHYDLGNDFYRLWLDASMTYSCAYFKRPDDTLEQAQEQKLDHVLGKLQLTAGQSLLDIGCGWGRLLVKAARDYGVTGLGVTLSREQHRHAQNLAEQAGVGGQVRFELLNYQDLPTRQLMFDRVVSVGFFEHVGRGNHHLYFQLVKQLLKPGGLSVLHSITNQLETPNDPWVDRYIFPGGYIPSLRETVKLLPEYGLRLIDYENLRPHYALTLDEWRRRFERHEAEITRRYDERFYRMWRLYLAGSSASFRYGDNDLSQLVFTNGINNTLPLTRSFLYRGQNKIKPATSQSQASGSRPETEPIGSGAK